MTINFTKKTAQNNNFSLPLLVARRDLSDADGDPPGGERDPVHRVAHADRQGLPGMRREYSNLKFIFFTLL